MLREGLETLVRLLNPMMPHITEELWEHLGHKTPWSKARGRKPIRFACRNHVTLAIQVNGKLRATMKP